MSGDERFLAAVKTHADRVLEHGRDRYGPEQTPLFADGLDVQTLEPPRWRHEGSAWIFSNQASQQNLFRTLVGLSRLTGDAAYRTAAAEAVAYMFEHYRDATGLPYWGGHQFVCLEEDRRITGFDADRHEFKNHFPFYEFLWQLDAAATRRLLEAVWNAHILDWAVLDMNRHGPWDQPMGPLWAHAFSDPAPFFHGDGLTFINCGTDLIYAAGLLSRLDDRAEPLVWARRMAALYVAARDPGTGLGAYQYSQPRFKEAPESDRRTSSRHGDRARRQFGPEFGARALEGRILIGGRQETIYGHNAVIQFQLAELLGEGGADFLTWTRDGCIAFATHAYDPESHTVTPMFTDGTALEGYMLRRDGYYGRAGRLIEREAVSPLLLYAFALGWRLTGDAELWQTLRSMARGEDLGELGREPGGGTALNSQTRCRDPLAIFALLELHKASGEGAYLEQARRVGENLLAGGVRNGFLVRSQRHRYCRFDDAAPLALLHLAAAIQGEEQAVPVYRSGSGYIHGQYDGHGRTYDRRVIWEQQRKRWPWG